MQIKIDTRSALDIVVLLTRYQESLRTSGRDRLTQGLTGRLISEVRNAICGEEERDRVDTPPPRLKASSPTPQEETISSLVRYISLEHVACRIINSSVGEPDEKAVVGFAFGPCGATGLLTLMCCVNTEGPSVLGRTVLIGPIVSAVRTLNRLSVCEESAPGLKLWHSFEMRYVPALWIRAFPPGTMMKVQQ